MELEEAIKNIEEIVSLIEPEDFFEREASAFLDEEDLMSLKLVFEDYKKIRGE